MSNLDPRIGKFNSSKFYAFANGYDQPEFIGTLDEVKTALGLLKPPSTVVSQSISCKEWTVKLVFQYPAWDEVDGIDYVDVRAETKSRAIAKARHMAQNDGHAVSGRGRYWFVATEAPN